MTSFANSPVFIPNAADYAEILFNLLLQLHSGYSRLACHPVHLDVLRRYA